ncbi:MAG: helix-turn-helix transcriptional regulator [Clostridia bacterium]|nr:helix-turn-helix transcriptional regulator [Clostridia bacterium]
MVADRIKTLRESKGITQSDLAKKLGITRSSVNAWEMGISVPSTQYIVELAIIFGVSTDYLLNVDDSATIKVDGLTEEDTFIVYNLIHYLQKKNKENI